MSTSGDAERLPSAPRGVSLRTVIDAARRLDELSTARLIGNVADAVHKAQQGGQPLGLLSPLAIAVEPDGSVALDRSAKAINAYGAPERLRGQTGDRRSDVFALGVILWEALAHDRLFGGATEDEMKAAVLDFAVEFRAPSERNANVPAELDAICKKALASDPANRYQSAKVMAAEIGAVLDDAGYPDSDDKIVAYLAAEFPGGAQPKAPVVAEAAAKGKPAGKVGTQTTLGIAPVPQPQGKNESGKNKKKKNRTPVKGEAVVRDVDSAWKSEPVVAPAPATIPSIVKPDVKPTEPPATKLPSSPITVPASIPPIAKAEPAPVADPPKPDLPPLDTTMRPTTPFAPADAPRPKTPTPSALPAWATARPGGGEPVLGNPKDTLRGVEPAPNATPPSQPLVLGPLPGATVEPASPPAPLLTAQFGALPEAEPVPVAAPPSPSTKTAILGSNSAIDDAARLAAVKWDDAMPPRPADPVIPPTISNAETVPTPALAATPVEVPTPAVEADSSGSQPHPASVVALPRAKSRGDQTKGDMLGGWGWGTDSHEAIYDDDDDDTARAGKRRLLFAIGGAAAAVLLVTVFAFAFSGGKDKPKTTEPTAPKAATWDQQQQDQAKQPPAPLPVPPVAEGSAEPPKPEIAEPPAPEAAKTDVPAPGTPETQTDAEKRALATAEAAKAEQARLDAEKADQAKKAEDAKAEQARLAQEKADAEKAKLEAAKAEQTKKAEDQKLAAEKAKAEQTKKAEDQKLAAEKAKAEQAKLAAEKAKADQAKKAEDQRLAAEKAKADQAKLAAARAEAAKQAQKKVVARRPEKKVAVAPKAQPIDPYATPEKKTPVPSGVDPNAAYRTGFQQYVRGDSNGALATFKASLASNPTYAPTWRGIGLVYEKLGKKSQARTAYRRYLQLSPAAGDAEQIRERLDKLP